ncbi:MAG: glycoside hydrolase family 13 protein [Firmicutes bacterium]|nr:glycoside hydrolase family 13 protein [Bacillota bacterium]
MNKHALLHIPLYSKFCFFSSNDGVVLRLRVSKENDFESIGIIYGYKYDFYKKQEKAFLRKKFSDELYDYYVIELKLNDVRLSYIFELKLKGKIYYYCEDGVLEKYDFSKAYFNSFQVPYINSIDVHKEVSWMKEAVFYQIFVDRFARGNFDKCDKYIDQKWDDIPTPKTFAGGDIKGIINNLDHIKNLGCNAIYLTPVFSSPSNHKYNITDYYTVDSHFGSNKCLKELIETARKNGIKIVLDAVFNHCGEDMKEWQDVVKKGKKSKYHGWFIINGYKPTKKPLNYECFSSCTYMPKFNTSNKEVQRFLIDISSYYIKEYDIDGWRLDVSDEVSFDFWRNFRRSVKSQKEDCVIIGENWHDASPYLQGDMFDSIMNYAFTKTCYEYFLDKSMNAKGLLERLSKILMNNSTQVNRMMLNLLDTHDTHRFLTLAKEDKNKLICALALCFMHMGAPMIYYGTELEMNGGYDPDCRRAFDWKRAEEKNKTKEVIMSLSELKKREELKSGGIRFSNEDEIFILERFNKNKAIKLYINNSGKDVELKTKGKILCSHNYENNTISSCGFVIEEVR